jgi:hypothetical protein
MCHTSLHGTNCSVVGCQCCMNPVPKGMQRAFTNRIQSAAAQAALGAPDATADHTFFVFDFVGGSIGFYPGASLPTTSSNSSSSALALPPSADCSSPLPAFAPPPPSAPQPLQLVNVRFRLSGLCGLSNSPLTSKALPNQRAGAQAAAVAATPEVCARLSTGAGRVHLQLRMGGREALHFGAASSSIKPKPHRCSALAASARSWSWQLQRRVRRSAGRAGSSLRSWPRNSSSCSCCRRRRRRLCHRCS